MTRILLALTLIVAMSPAFAINMNDFKGTPIALLTVDEKKAFHTALVQVLNQSPDRTTVDWKASKTSLATRITPLKRFDEGQLMCRETVIESNVPDRQHHGSYVFCRNLKGEWQFKQPVSKAAAKKK